MESVLISPDFGLRSENEFYTAINSDLCPYEDDFYQIVRRGLPKIYFDENGDYTVLSESISDIGYKFILLHKVKIPKTALLSITIKYYLPEINNNYQFNLYIAIGEVRNLHANLGMKELIDCAIYRIKDSIKAKYPNIHFGDNREYKITYEYMNLI